MDRSLVVLTLSLAVLPAEAQESPDRASPLCAVQRLYVDPGRPGTPTRTLNRELRRFGSFQVLDRPAEGVPELKLTTVYESHASRARGLLDAELKQGGNVTFQHRTTLFPELREAAKEVSATLIGAFNEQCTTMPASDPSAQTETEAQPLIENLTDEAKEMLDEAVRLHESSQLDEAVVVWRKYLRVMPNDSFGYANLAVTQMQLDDFRGAVRSLERSVKLNSQNDIALYNLAFAYYRVGRVDRSLRAIEATLHINPWHEKALSLLARIRAERR